MSHVTDIQAEVKNLESLKTACIILKLKFMENQKTYRWYGRFMNDSKIPDWLNVSDLGHCIHAIKVPGADYEIGVVKDPKGEWKLLLDYWREGGLEKQLGKDAHKLTHMMGIINTLQEAKNKGHDVSQQKLKDRTRVTIALN